METNEKFIELRSSSNTTDPSQVQRSRQSAMTGKTRQQFTRAPYHKQYGRPLIMPRTSHHGTSQQPLALPVYR